MAVVSCRVCSLVSISKATVPMRISPHFSPPLAWLLVWAGGLLLATQQAVKKARAINKSRGPMMMGGLPEGMKVPKAKAPTRVMLMPANKMHRPHAQHSAGEGRLCLHLVDCLGTLASGGLQFLSGGTMSLNQLSRIHARVEKLKIS